jgi:stalled ribosome rescue protein Dom34
VSQRYQEKPNSLDLAQKTGWSLRGKGDNLKKLIILVTEIVMSLNHAVVWIDHQEAHVMFLSEQAGDAEVIRTKAIHPHLHHKGGEIGSGRVELDSKYLHSVVQAVKDSREILILGPGFAKLELIKYAHRHNAAVAEKIVGVETVDHPTDKEILAYARKFFYKVDRML